MKNIVQVRTVSISKRKLNRNNEVRIDISAGSGYGPSVLKPEEAIQLAHELLKMAGGKP